MRQIDRPAPGLPQEMASDQGPQFSSRFWKAFCSPDRRQTQPVLWVPPRDEWPDRALQPGAGEGTALGEGGGGAVCQGPHLKSPEVGQKPRSSLCSPDCFPDTNLRLPIDHVLPACDTRVLTEPIRYTSGSLSSVVGPCLHNINSEPPDGPLLWSLVALLVTLPHPTPCHPIPCDLEQDGFSRNPFFQCIIAEVPEQHRTKEGHAKVGYALYFYTYSSWKGRSVYMEDLYVMPEFRGKGIGKALMSKIAQVSDRLLWCCIESEINALFTAWTWGQTRDMSRSFRNLQDSLKQLSAQQSALATGGGDWLSTPGRGEGSRQDVRCAQEWLWSTGLRLTAWRVLSRRRRYFAFVTTGTVVGDDGVIKGWTEELLNVSKAVQYNPDTGTFRVERSGVYFLYCQVHFNENQSLYVKLVVSVNQARKLQCVEGYGTTPSAGSHQFHFLKPCQVSGLLRLEKGAELKATTIKSYRLHTVGKHYFGLFKLVEELNSVIDADHLSTTLFSLPQQQLSLPLLLQRHGGAVQHCEREERGKQRVLSLRMDPSPCRYGIMRRYFTMMLCTVDLGIRSSCPMAPSDLPSFHRSTTLPLLASLLSMLLSDICRRAAMGGTRERVAGSRVTSAFMSLSSSSSWFSTAMTTAIPTVGRGERPFLQKIWRHSCSPVSFAALGK
ncbi:hypothetical protein AAFF_G00325290 [Aldrovandia affinis]|uniref:THD domain-containing protein n=1 Tax=Aldrovandia affinis TaxID=143900 RepID=A0AAD7X0L7_9TELE|nr:hypothetical protein AAFF_G00325290 [Aldrovandia affinis]